MDLLTILIFSVVFLFSASLVEVAYLIWTESRFAEKRKVKKRLMTISAGGRHGEKTLSIYRDRAMRDAGAVEKWLFSLPRIASLDRMLLKANMPVNVSVFLMGTLAFAFVGFWIGLRFLPHAPSAALMGFLLGGLPFLLLRSAEKKSLEKFEEQLPEALDLLARALRSGHSLSSGMATVAEEMEVPIKTEFAAAVDEISLGLSLREALENLCERVPSRDCRFFALAVLIQKDTGGNIAEILDNISRLIRERMQFKRQVQALTAEGRLSAWILILLPIGMFLYIYVVNYEYIALLWQEEVGRLMLGAAALLQVVGVLVIRKIVQIEI